jgi:hypothetical protein
MDVLRCKPGEQALIISGYGKEAMAQAVAEDRGMTFTVVNALIFSFSDYLRQMLIGLPISVTPGTVIVDGFPRGRKARSRMMRTIMSKSLRIGNWVFDTPAFIFCVSDRMVLDVWNDGTFRWNVINLGDKED